MPSKRKTKLYIGIAASGTLFLLILSDAWLQHYELDDQMMYLLLAMISAMLGVDIVRQSGSTSKMSPTKTDDSTDTEQSDESSSESSQRRHRGKGLRDPDRRRYRDSRRGIDYTRSDEDVPEPGQDDSTSDTEDTP